jgi:hypothetical protein
MGSLMEPLEPQVFPGLTAGGLHTLEAVEMGEVLSPRCGAREKNLTPFQVSPPPGGTAFVGQSPDTARPLSQGA